VTLWARLTWQAAEPATRAADLERRLGVTGRDGGLVPGSRLLDLGTAYLEVRPWVREGPADNPHPAGRLMLEPVPGGEEVPGSSLSIAAVGAVGAVGAVAQAAPDPARLVLVGLGWSTVDLDRAESDLEMWLADGAGSPAPDGVPDPADPHLGARARIRGSAGLPGEWLVLLEPSTEGRAAAALARDGEGPCALYLWPPGGLPAWLLATGAQGVTVTGTTRPGGPFGDQVLLAGPPPAGPHVIVVGDRTPAPLAGGASTIAP